MTSCDALARGKSAYEIAVDNGFTGTEVEWLQSLKGAQGNDGQDGLVLDGGTYTVYQIYTEAVSHSVFTGTFDEFIKEYFTDTDKDDKLIENINLGLLQVCDVVSNYTYVSNGYPMSGAQSGSGIFYQVDKENGDAIVLTNFHNVYSTNKGGICDTIQIYLYGNETTEGAVTCEYIGGCSTYDVALLKITNSEVIKQSDVIAVTFADTQDLVVGETLYAVGNSYGYGISAKTGILSVDSEYITLQNSYGNTTNYRVIRFDVPTNLGDSGGGVFNSEGKLVGIVNAKTVVESVEGMCYGIPSNILVSVAKQIMTYNYGKEDKNFYKPMLGITIESKSSSAVYDKNTKTTKVVENVIISQISETSFVKGVLEVGDRLLTIKVGDDKERTVDRRHILIDSILGAKVGDIVTFTVERGSETLTKTVTISQDMFSVYE